MEQISYAIRQMITTTDEELNILLSNCYIKKFKKKEIISMPSTVPNDVFFINKGIIRVIVADKKEAEHTIHFATENQFFTDYSSFLQQQPSLYTLQALEKTEVVVMPRKAIEWGYQNMKQGDKLGRLIAEFYFIYQDNRVKNIYARTPKERYDTITDVFRISTIEYHNT